jgi:hypothetical protein
LVLKKIGRIWHGPSRTARDAPFLKIDLKYLEFLLLTTNAQHLAVASDTLNTNHGAHWKEKTGVFFRVLERGYRRLTWSIALSRSGSFLISPTLGSQLRVMVSEFCNST